VTEPRFKLLVVDDEPSVGMIFFRILEEAGYDLISASNGAEGLRVLKKQDIKMVFLDLQMPGMDGVETLRRLRQSHPDLPVVIMTAYQTVSSAVQTMKLGALDYILKPLEAKNIKHIVEQALLVGKVTSRMAKVPPLGLAVGDVPRFVSSSREMKKVMTLIDKVAPTDITVLVLGESGTGKEVVASTIHQKSPRCNKPFVVVDCTALPEQLIESELFGYERGAFTGADLARPGKFEQADGGTLFLDEIGNLPLSVQAKLLRFLQDTKIERLGSRKGPVPLNVRVLAATNASLEKKVDQGTFREDLFHRLKVFEIDLPPLRQRGSEDLDDFLGMFLDRFCRQLGKKKLLVAPETIGLLKAYRWPGNVREFQNALRSATLLADEIILPDHLPLSIQTFRPDPSPKVLAREASPVIRRVEKEHIQNMMKKHLGEISTVAKELNLSQEDLEKKLEGFGLV